MPSSGSCGENVTYTFDSETGLLTISGNGFMYNYDTMDSPFSSQTVIKTVVINNGVTSIGNCVFWRCSGLTSITIPNSVTSIGGEAFCLCGELTGITIPNSVTSIGDDAFNGCSVLTSVIIPNSVTSIGMRTFKGCSGLTSVNIPASVISINNFAFEGCSRLTSIAIPNSVTNIGPWAFKDCSGLTDITIPDSVTSIGYAAFYGCSGLTSVSIPNFVTSIGELTFYGCGGLTSVSISNSVTSIGKRAFDGCYSLTSITIPGSVKFIGHEAFGSSSIEKITFNDNPTEIKTEYNSLFKSEGLKVFEIPESVSYIGDAAFKDCKNLITVTIPKSVIRIEYNAFSGSTNLTVRGYQNSYAETFCKWAGIPFEAIEESHTHSFSATVIAPTATALGYMLRTCSCGEKYKDTYTAPTGKLTLKHSARTANAIKVQWNNVKTATGYQVQISNAAGNKWSTYATLKAGVTAYTFKNLAAGSNYKFRVRFYITADDGKNYYSPWSNTLSSPTLPKGTTARATAAKKAFTAKWTKVAGVTGYQVQYSTNAKFSKAVTKTVKGASKYSLAVKNLKGGARYYVRIRTYKTIGGKNYFSAWSAARAVTTKK